MPGLLCLLLALAIPIASAQVSVKLDFSSLALAANKPFDLKATLSTKGKIVPAKSFIKGHERLLHVVGLGYDCDRFFHIHPEDLGKSPISQDGVAFLLSGLSLPKAGKYTLSFDGRLTSGDVTAKTTLTVSGSPGMMPKPYSNRVGLKQITTKALKNKSNIPGLSLTSLVGTSSTSPSGLLSGATYGVSLSGPTGNECVPGKAATYAWKVTKGGAPVKDLTPFLGADMHVATVSEDGSYFTHGHGMAMGPGMGAGAMMDHAEHGASSGKFGPDVYVQLTLPKSGLFVLVGQLSRGGDLIVAPFWITCTGSAAKPSPKPMPMPSNKVPAPKPTPSPIDMGEHAGHHMR